jgi:hypothetical protein
LKLLERNSVLPLRGFVVEARDDPRTAKTERKFKGSWRNLRMTRSLGLLTCAVLTFCFVGCSVYTDNGIPCDLIKSGADGGVKVLESEVTPGKDFVSFGVTECENFICVRASSAPKSGDPNAVATGRCSSRCASEEARCGSANDAKLSCRPLILDEVTLGKICLDSPQKCKELFGGPQGAYFCAEASTVDAGT